MMVANTIALNVNHNKIQQFHVEFCYLIKLFWTLQITTKSRWQNEKGTKQKVGLGTTLMITLLHVTKCI
jgi:hypothetical protein